MRIRKSFYLSLAVFTLVCNHFSRAFAEVDLTLGGTYNGTISLAGQHDAFTFTGTAGQRLYYDALDADNDAINVQLISPSGAIPFINGNSDSDIGPFTLTETGTYTLLQYGSGDYTNDYAFRLLDVAQSPVKTLTFDTAVSGTNVPTLAAAIYRFTGTNGQRLFFDFAATNVGSASVALYGTQNQYVNGGSLSGDFEQTLPADGIYFLVIGNTTDASATNFSFRVVTPNTTTNALTLGATVTGTLDEPGEEDRFTFTGTTGQRFYYDALDADNDAINVQLIGPGGAIPFLNGNSDTDVGLFTLTETGTYTLIQKGSGDFTNDYSFRLLDLVLGPVITNGVAVTNTLNPQTSARLYRINGTAGQRLGITNLAASSGNANWSLASPNNTPMLSDNILNSLGAVTLPTTGTYALLVVGGQNFIGGLDYQFRVSLVSSASGGTSGFGTTQSGSTIFDQTNAFSYTAPAGLPVYFDSLTNNSTVNVQLIAPGGNQVFSVNGGADAGPYFLPESGNYTLNVIGTADGSFDFRLLNLNVDATNLVFGTTYNPTLSPAFRTDIYRFTGTNGQRLYYDAQEYDGDAVGLQLFNPNGEITLINGNSDTDVGPFTLTETGTYYLAIISQLADDTADYSFRLLDVAQLPAQSLTFDTTVNGTNVPVTSASVYRFTGTNGQRLFFDFAVTNIGTALVYLYGPQNQSLYSSYGNWLYTDFEQTLPADGTYVLAIGNYTDASAPNFSFRVVTPNTTTNALTLGATVTGSLEEAGEEDRFTFNGTAGQRLYYDALDSDNDAIYIQLISPSGAMPFINGGNSDTDVGPFTLTETGTYTLLQKATGDYTNDYSFRLIDVSQLPAKALAFDMPANGTSLPVTSASVYRFTGTNGQRLFFDFAATNIGVAIVNLYGPQNQSLNGNYGNYLTTDFEQTLPADGIYVLTIGNYIDASATNFSFRVVTPNTTTNALALNVSATGSLDEPGEADYFTFTGTAGQRIYYDALDPATNASIYVQLLGPNGAIVIPNQPSTYDAGPYTLPETGTYTLLQKVTGSGDYTNVYNFRLIDLSQAPVKNLTFDTTVNVTNIPATAAAMYRFAGTNGQRLFFDFALTNVGYGSYNLYGPQFQPSGPAYLNVYGIAQNFSTDFEVTLPADGTYNFMVGNTTDASATNFNFRVVTPNTTTNALTMAATVTGSLDEPGEEDRFTFTGTVGQRLYYDALDAGGDAIYIQLINPDGTTPFINYLNFNSDNDVGPFTLTASGTYTLLQKSGGDNTGDYSFRLLDLAASPVITNGVAVTNTLNPQTMTRLYRINGTAGQRLGVTNLGASSGNANWSLVRPDNAGLLSDNILNNLGEVTLPTTGTYGLLVVGGQNFIGGLDYQFRVSLVSSASGGTSGFGTVHGGGTIFDQTNSFSYTAPAGLPVYFDSLTNNSTVNIQLIAPSGSQVFSVNGGADAGPYFLPESGNYTLNVIGTADGSFDFRLLDLNVDATNLVFGTTYNSTLSPAFRTDIYRFTGTNGQRLHYDALEYDGDAVQVYLFNSSGGNVFINGNSDTDVGPFTLTETGTYYLAIISQLADDTVDYSFRLLDGSQLPAQSLTFDTAVNGTLDPGLDADIYRVVGTAGQRLYFDGASTNIYPVGYWQLFGPENQSLGQNWVSGDFEVTLPASGTNLLLVYSYGNNDTNALPYSFKMVTPDTTTNALTLGATVAGTLNEAGEEDRYTFTGTAGQRLYFDALDADNDSINVQLISPSGAMPFINGGNSDTDVGPFTLTESGTYMLLLKGSAETTGDYSFRVLDVAVQPFISLDATNSGAATPSTAAQLFQFNSLAHLRLYLDDLGSTPGYGAWYLYNPGNSSLGGNTIGYDFEVADPALSATFLLVFNSGYTNDYNYTFRIVPGNHAPVLAAIASRTNNELVALTFTNNATDIEVDNDQLTFTLDPGAPTGAAIGPVTGVFTWTPTEAQGPGVYPVTVRVTDDGIPSFNDSKSFNITVNEVNVAPVLTVPVNTNINELATLTVANTATDPDIPTNALSFTLVSPLSGMAINAANGVFTWTPTEAQGPGTNIITVVLTDTNPPAVNAKSLSTTNTFTVIVNELNVAPVLTVPTNQTINELTFYTNNATATDSDSPANPLTFALVSGPAGLTVSTNGAITWTPTEAQGPGAYVINVSVTDTNPPAINAKSFSVTNSFTLTVNEVNVAPVLTVPANTNINELATLTVTNTTTDSDFPANTPTFSLVSPLSGMAINATNGVFTWTPTEAQGPSTNTITVVVTDTNAFAVNSKQLSTTNTFTVVVNELNESPVLTVPANTNINELATLTVTNTATDSDFPANALTFALVSPLSGMAINATNGVFSWTPTEAQGPSTNIITVVVADTNAFAVNAKQLSTTNTFTVVVNELNEAPVLTVPANTNINELATLTVTNTATDSDFPANALTFALVSPLSGMAINATNGVFAWTPTEAQGPSTNIITVVVTDTNAFAVISKQLSTTNTFAVIVNEVNVAPGLALPANSSFNEQTFYTNNATAADPDIPVNALTFALVSGPTGMVVNAASGAITWTPGEFQGPGVHVVQIKVTDTNPPAINAKSLSVTNSFTLTVNEVNVAPAVGPLTNRTVNPGQTITITATATDPDLPANTLLFSLVSPPGSATITGGGLFHWRPTVAEADTTNVVKVRVTDNGTPNLSDTNAFTVIVNALSPVVLMPISYSNGQFSFLVSGTTGPDYIFLASSNLTAWSDISTNLSPATPFLFTNASAATNRFYRARLAP